MLFRREKFLPLQYCPAKFFLNLCLENYSRTVLLFTNSLFTTTFVADKVFGVFGEILYCLQLFEHEDENVVITNIFEPIVELVNFLKIA